MTKQTEALKLALEAFEIATTLLAKDRQEVLRARNAIREALAEQPAQQEPVAVVSGYYGGQCVILPIDPARIFNSNTALYTSPQPAQQEPVALKWQQSPIRTAWGDDMVVASVAIDNDHTLSLYCERDQTPKVDAMFAQRTWVGLTQQDIDIAFDDTQEGGGFDDFARAIETKLREKNNA